MVAWVSCATRGDAGMRGGTMVGTLVGTAAVTRALGHATSAITNSNAATLSTTNATSTDRASSTVSSSSVTPHNFLAESTIANAVPLVTTLRWAKIARTVAMVVSRLALPFRPRRFRVQCRKRLAGVPARFRRPPIGIVIAAFGQPRRASVHCAGLGMNYAHGTRYAQGGDLVFRLLDRGRRIAPSVRRDFGTIGQGQIGTSLICIVGGADKRRRVSDGIALRNAGQRLIPDAEVERPAIGNAEGAANTVRYGGASRRHSACPGPQRVLVGIDAAQLSEHPQASINERCLPR